jgi:hypothetical protein
VWFGFLHDHQLHPIGRLAQSSPCSSISPLMSIGLNRSSILNGSNDDMLGRNKSFTRLYSVRLQQIGQVSCIVIHPHILQRIQHIHHIPEVDLEIDLVAGGDRGLEAIAQLSHRAHKAHASCQKDRTDAS